MTLESLDPRFVGERLRIARGVAGLTQDCVANRIGMARTTVVAIENGKRKVRIDEIQILAKIYGTSTNALLRQEAIHVDLVPRFRRLAGTNDEAVSNAVAILAGLVRAEVELENVLGVKRQMNLPPERQILDGDVRMQAESDAMELRYRLGLGISPIIDIVSLLELEMGVRVYIRRLDSKISGLFAFDEKIGACVLLNANHHHERRVQSAAHECGHIVSTRSKPEILHLNEKIRGREEKYADVFGRVFLTPARAVKQKFNEVTAGSKKLTRRHVILIGRYFGVSREAIVRRLEELSLVPSGTWNWFASHGGITNAHVEKIFGKNEFCSPHRSDLDSAISFRLMMLAAEAFQRELYTEGQLSELLGLSRVKIRSILCEPILELREKNGTVNILG